MKNEKSLNSQLKEAKLIIFFCKVLLTTIHNAKAIQIWGLLISLFWVGYLFYSSGSLSGAPIIVIAGFLFVKFYWIPTSNIESQRKELEQDIIEYTEVKNSILERLAISK